MMMCVTSCANLHATDTYCLKSFVILPTEKDRQMMSDSLARQILLNNLMYKQSCYNEQVEKHGN